MVDCEDELAAREIVSAVAGNPLVVSYVVEYVSVMLPYTIGDEVGLATALSDVLF